MQYKYMFRQSFGCAEWYCFNWDSWHLVEGVSSWPCTFLLSTSMEWWWAMWTGWCRAMWTGWHRAWWGLTQLRTQCHWCEPGLAGMQAGGDCFVQWAIIRWKLFKGRTLLSGASQAPWARSRPSSSTQVANCGQEGVDMGEHRHGCRTTIKYSQWTCDIFLGHGLLCNALTRLRAWAILAELWAWL
jgi:hypothetical protein